MKYDFENKTFFGTGDLDQPRLQIESGPLGCVFIRLFEYFMIGVKTDSLATLSTHYDVAMIGGKSQRVTVSNHKWARKLDEKCAWLRAAHEAILCHESPLPICLETVDVLNGID